MAAMTKAKVAEICRKHKEISKRGLAQQYENTESCWSFYNADQMTYSDRIQFEDTWGRKRRAIVNFNKVQVNVDSVAGFFAQNRRRAKYIARVKREQRQEIYSRNMNALHGFHRENMNADQIESSQDVAMLVNGYGAIDTDMSYVIGQVTTMPGGEIIKKFVTNPYWDPNAMQINNLDARWAGYWEDFELKDALALFQDSKEDDFEEVSAEEPSDTGYIFNPYGGIYDKIKLMNTVEWTSKESEMVRVYNHQWMEYETYYVADNPLFKATSPEVASYTKLKLDMIAAQIKPVGDSLSGDMFDFNPTAEKLYFDDATKRALVKEFGDLLTPIAGPFKRKVFYSAVVSGDHVFTWFKNISQQGFSIKFKTGVWNRNRKMWMGMVNPMMEPQKYYNKALTEIMFTIAANSKGGVMIEEDAVEDIADFETKWAKTDAVIKVTSGALAAGKIQEKARSALPTGLEGVLQLADANLISNGVDPAFLGDVGNEDQSGILFKRRIRQVMSKMARYADSITLFQKEDARMMADLIRVWVQNNQGTWMRITGEDGADDFMQVCEDMLAPEYDVDIQEASQSADEQQETAILLSGFGDKLLMAGDVQSGKAFMAESLQFMRLDGEIRNRLSGILQPKEQQIDPQQVAMMQQQLQQLQQIVQSGQVEKMKSEAQKNLAVAAKTMKDADLTEAQLPKVHAETVRTLEEARRTAMEVQQGKSAQSDNVSISI